MGAWFRGVFATDSLGQFCAVSLLMPLGRPAGCAGFVGEAVGLTGARAAHGDAHRMLCDLDGSGRICEVVVGGSLHGQCKYIL